MTRVRNLTFAHSSIWKLSVRLLLSPAYSQWETIGRMYAVHVRDGIFDRVLIDIGTCVWKPETREKLRFSIENEMAWEHSNVKALVAGYHKVCLLDPYKLSLLHAVARTRLPFLVSLQPHNRMSKRERHPVKGEHLKSKNKKYLFLVSFKFNYLQIFSCKWHLEIKKLR